MSSTERTFAQFDVLVVRHRLEVAAAEDVVRLEDVLEALDVRGRRELHLLLAHGGTPSDGGCSKACTGGSREHGPPAVRNFAPELLVGHAELLRCGVHCLQERRVRELSLALHLGARKDNVDTGAAEFSLALEAAISAELRKRRAVHLRDAVAVRLRFGRAELVEHVLESWQGAQFRFAHGRALLMAQTRATARGERHVPRSLLSPLWLLAQLTFVLSATPEGPLSQFRERRRSRSLCAPVRLRRGAAPSNSSGTRGAGEPTPDARLLLVRLRAFERARVCCLRCSLLACGFVGPPVPRSLACSSAPPRRRLCATIKDHTLTQGCEQLKLAAQHRFGARAAHSYTWASRAPLARGSKTQHSTLERSLIRACGNLVRCAAQVYVEGEGARESPPDDEEEVFYEGNEGPADHFLPLGRKQTQRETQRENLVNGRVESDLAPNFRRWKLLISHNNL